MCYDTDVPKDTDRKQRTYKMRQGTAITIAIARRYGWKNAMRVVEVCERVGDTMEETAYLMLLPEEANLMVHNARLIRNQGEYAASLIAFAQSLRNEGYKVEFA